MGHLPHGERRGGERCGEDGRILRIIEDTAYPNDGFWKLRWGVEIDGFVVKDAGDGWKFMNVQGEVGVNKRGYCDGCTRGLYDCGYSIASRGDKLIEGASDELAGATLAELQMNKAAPRLPTHGLPIKGANKRLPDLSTHRPIDGTSAPGHTEYSDSPTKPRIIPS